MILLPRATVGEGLGCFRALIQLTQTTNYEIRMPYACFSIVDILRVYRVMQSRYTRGLQTYAE